MPSPMSNFSVYVENALTWNCLESVPNTEWDYCNVYAITAEPFGLQNRYLIYVYGLICIIGEKYFDGN